MRGKGYFLVIAVLVGFYLANQYPAWLLICCVWLFFLLICFKHGRLLLLELAVLTMMTIFFSAHFIPDQFDLAEDINREISVVGEVTEVTSQTEAYTIFTIVEQELNQSFQVSDFSGLNQAIRRGARCQIKGELQLPDQATNPGQFNYQNYLSTQGINYQMIVNDQSNLVCEGTNLIGRIEHLRTKQLHFVETKFSDQTAIWIKSLIFGEQKALDDDVKQLFQRWHLSHLLAISGLHISILVLILHVILIYVFRLTKESTYQFLIGFLLLYPMIAGGAPSVWRASIVSILNYLAFYQRNRSATIDFLSLSFVLLLFLKPDWIHTLGFQFSFIISFAILLSKRILVQINPPFLQMIFISGLSLLIILPIQINSFYLFNPLSLIVNVLATSYFSLYLMPLIFFTYLTGFLFPPFVAIFDFVVQCSNQLFLFFLTKIDQYLYYPMIIGRLTPLIIVLFYVSLFYLFIQLEKRQFLKMINGLICLGLIMLTHQLLPFLNPYGKVTILDLGEANSLVIELPHRQAVILYDLGATLGTDFESSSDRAYEQVIKPFLYQAGINKIDAVILSHEDQDHSGSLTYLLKDFSVQTVITSDYFEWEEKLKNVLQETRVDHQVVAYGQQFSIGGQLFYPLSPTRNWRNRNDNSLVLYTEFSDQSWLLTGDMSNQVEQSIIKNMPELKIDTLLVAHHGSATSSGQEFLEAISADQAIIPVGRNNRFNHPNDQVISRLKSVDLTIYRTDYHGAIQYIFHKNRPGGTFLPFIP